MITKRQLVKLVKYGYLPHTKFPLDSPEVVDAVDRMKEFMGVSTLDADSLFAIPRCGEPDIVPDDTGSGSWPVGCHTEHPEVHSFAVFFDMRFFPKHWEPAFEEAWNLVQQAYADIGMVFFRTMDRSKANTIVTWQIGSGWIGLAIVPRGPRCGQQIWAKYDNRYGRSFALQQLIYQLAYLMGHEKGHNMGLSHSRGGIMNPSLINGVFKPNQWRGDPSYPILKRWFGGEPVAPPAPSIPIWTIPQPENPQ